MTVEVAHRQGGLTLAASFTLTAPWTVLFGSSGSGKTTVLRTVQGFVRPDAGRIMLSNTAVLDTASGVFVPAHQRPVRSAGQAARLFAGMTVRENVLYGAETDAGATLLVDVLRLLRLEALTGNRPEALSGGERQRVSVARAVMAAASRTEGTLLLLDEPFAGLGHALRDAIAVELRDWLRERRVMVLSVTHDVGEAFLLGAEVLRMEAGRIADQGPVRWVLAGEREQLLRQMGNKV